MTSTEHKAVIASFFYCSYIIVLFWWLLQSLVTLFSLHLLCVSAGVVILLSWLFSFCDVHTYTLFALHTFSLYVSVQRQITGTPLPTSVSAHVCVSACVCAPWLYNGGSKVEGACMPVCVGVCIGGCMCVFARLAPGSQAITLYEVWQGESKTSASPKKSPGLGLVLGLDSEHIHTLTHIHLTALKKIHTCLRHTARTFKIHKPWS